MITNQAVSATSPLMQPVNFDGSIYFSSQYFYQIYAKNGGINGKYERHGNFIRLIRSIPAYNIYVSRNDIVEICYFKGNNITANDMQISDSNIESLIKSNSYRSVMLINATAQVALMHHLDDEISKLSSVSINSHVASEETKNKLIASLSDTLLFADFMAKYLNLSDDEKIQNASVIAEEYGLPLGIVTHKEKKTTEKQYDPVSEFSIRKKISADENKVRIIGALSRRSQSVGSLKSSKSFRSMSRIYLQSLIDELCNEGIVFVTTTDKLKGNEKIYNVVAA